MLPYSTSLLRFSTLARLWMGAALVCLSLGSRSFAQFAEIYPFRITAVTLDSFDNVYFSCASNNVITAVIKSTGMQMQFSTANPSLSQPSGVSTDMLGNLYIADTGNHRIVKVNSTGAQVFVFRTINSSLLYPTGVSLDHSGNLYIADTGNHRIVKLNPTGVQVAVFSTVSPSLLYPTGVSLDRAGNLYIADSGNNRIVKLNPIGAQVFEFRTVNPSLLYPYGVSLDTAGNLYIADTDNNRIVKLDRTGAQVAVFRANLKDPTGVSLDSIGNVFVVDSSNNRVVKLNPIGAEVAVFMTINPFLHVPRAVVPDSAGNLYIADSYSHRVVKLDSTGTQMAEFSFSLNYPFGVSFDFSGNLYIADRGNGRIVKLDPTGAIMAQFRTINPPLNAPTCTSLDPVGNLYIADRGNNRIVKLSSKGEQMAVFMTIDPSLNFATGVSLDSACNLYIADTRNHRIVKLDPTGAQIAEFRTISPLLNEPHGIALDFLGNMYIADSGNNRIVKLDRTGAQMAEFRTNNPSLDFPSSVYLNPLGDLYIADSNNNRIVKLDSTGAQVDTFMRNIAFLRNPNGLSFDSVGNLYIVDSDHNRVMKLNSTNALVADFRTSNPSLDWPRGISLDSTGNMYIADAHNNRIVKLNSKGAQVAVFMTINPSLDTPHGIALDSVGNIYITDTWNNRIVKLNLTGAQVAEFRTTDPSLNLPHGIVSDSADCIYIADRNNNRIVKMSSIGALVAVFKPYSLWIPYCLTLDSAGNIYITDGYRRVVTLNSAGVQMDVFSTINPPLKDPTGVSLDSAGNIYVADSGENTIVVFINPCCPLGYYCPFLMPIMCPGGYFCPSQYVNSIANVTVLPCPTGYHCPNGTSDPLPCHEKYFCPPISIYPIPCPASYYCIEASDDPRTSYCNSTHCSGICPKGHYCPYMSAIPTPCPQFTYGDELGLTNASCSGNCPPGTYCNQVGRTSANCSGVCELGDYCLYEATQPLPCPGGSYCPNPATLLPCLPGYYGREIRMTEPTCSGPCDAGFVCTENSVTARQQPCPPGQYNNMTGQSECVKCSPGWYAETSANGTLTCSPCSAGQYSPNPGASICQYCPSGHFNDGTGQAACTLCPPGTSASDDVENRIGCNPCPLGYFSAGGRCEPCPRGTYSLLNGSMECMSCSGIEGTDCEGGIAYISKAYHGAVEIHRSLLDTIVVRLTTQRCPDGYCVGANSSMFSDIGASVYLESDRTDPLVFSLPHQCSENHDQSFESPLCGACSDGYAPPDVGSPYLGCVRCDGFSYIKFSILFGMSWILMLVYYVASNGRLGLMSSFLYNVQTIAIMVSSQPSLTAWFRTFGFSPVALMPALCFAPMSPELQYVIPLLIAPIQLVQLGITVLFHYLLKRYGSPPKYELDELTMAYTMSRDQSPDVAQWSCFLSTLVYLCSLVRYRVCPELTVSTVVRTIFLIISASFTSVILTCISWFHCTPNTVIGLSAISGSVVYAFPAIFCHSSSYFGWSWVMGGYLVLWSLVIVLATWWLAMHSKQLATLQSLSQSTSVSDVSSDSSTALRISVALPPQTHSEAILDHVCIPFMNVVSFAYYWPMPAAATVDWDKSICESSVDDVRMETRRVYAFRSVYGTLYDSFRTGATGWMIVIWIRRLLLIVLSVMLTTVPTAKYMSFVMLHVMIACLQVYYQPYTTSVLNEIEQVAIITHIFMATVLTAYPSPANAAVQAALLTLTIVPLVSYFMFRLAQSTLLKTKQRKARTRALERSETLSASLLSSNDHEFDLMD